MSGVEDDIFETRSTRSASSAGNRSMPEEDDYSEKSFKESDFDDDGEGSDAGSAAGSVASGDDNIQDSDEDEGDAKESKKKLNKKKSSLDEDGDEKVDTSTFFSEKKKKKRKKSKGGDDVEDGGEGKRKKKKRKEEGKSKSKPKKKFNFFADEADEADDDSEQERDGDEPEVREEILTREELEARQRVEQRNAKIQQWKEVSAEEQARQLEERYQQDKQADRLYKKMDFTRITRGKSQAFTHLPTVFDPKIFKLRCKPGMEYHVIRSLMLKAADFRVRDGFSKIKSAFCGNTKGYIYVESISEMLVKELLSGLISVYHNSLAQVPLNEMTSLLNITVQKKPLEENQFVRFTRGALKGDLARIVAIYDGGDSVVVQAIPRPLYSEEEKAQNKLAIKKDPSLRPPQRLFDPELAKASGLECRNAPFPRESGPLKGRCNLFMNDLYYGGFMIKEVKVETFLNTKDVQPTIDEMKWFQMKNINDEIEEDSSYMQEGSGDREKMAADRLAREIEALSTKNMKHSNPFVPGDLVKVIGGELQNVVGKIVSVNEDAKTAKIVSLGQTFKGAMDVEINMLMKYVEVGAHVKVMAGQYIGQTGRVVSMSTIGGRDQIAAITTDGTQQLIQCNISYLQITDEIAIGSDTLAGHKLHDLVALNENEPAMIIKVGTEKLTVVNKHGTVKEVVPQEIRYKLNSASMRESGLDGKGNRFKCGDMLYVDTGLHAKQSGTVKHISKGFVWLHNNLYHKNNGVFVVKSSMCSLSGSSIGGATFETSYATSIARNPRPSSSSSSGTNDTPISNNFNAPAVEEIRVNSKVKITKGNFRGYVGTVLDVNGNFVQVQLDAKFKKVPLQKDALKLLVTNDNRMNDGNMGVMNYNTGPFNPYTGGGNGFVGAETPHIASQTPNYIGGETPRVTGAETPGWWGGMTPSRSDEANAWKINSDDFDNNQGPTSYRGGGSATPMSYADNDRVFPTSNTITPSSNYMTQSNFVGGSSSSVRSNFDSTPSIATSTPSVAPTSAVSTDVIYEVGMIIQGKAGEAMGKRYVIVDIVDENTYKAKFRDGMGRLQQEIQLNSNDFSLAVPAKKGVVKFISGNYKGRTGVVAGVTGKDAMVQIDGIADIQMVKSSNVAWMHDMSSG